ncbi:hypothetical protein V501_05094 [Pseudogymnoascus sp. VKM F-4519 (FW-2642)]|nr:hypothetical protein V501_05094 [Pseudogymnoascus sp. VKM F-4519 (FW-2642)]
MQIHGSKKLFRTMPDCARYVFRTEGLRAFYVSYPTTLSMTVPFTALQFLAYESISTSMNPTKAYDPVTHCAAGAVAGGFAAALTTPMDVVKTMLQTRGSASDAALRNVNGFVEGWLTSSAATTQSYKPPTHHLPPAQEAQHSPEHP